LNPTYPNAIQQRIDELMRIDAPSTARDDLDRFWERTLAEFGPKPLNGRREKRDTPLQFVDAYMVTYEGFDATPLHGWFLLPAFVPQRNLPCVVHYHGYTGGSGFPEEYSQWLLMGLAVFAVDVRGQGGETGNLLPQTFGMTKGWITQGITDKERCYYRAIAVDSLKALEWAGEQPEIDPSRIAVVGSSQGGGLALIAAALSEKPALVLANIPNMCQMDFGLLNSTGSLTEAAEFVARFPDKLDQVLDTLSYFDLVNLADRIRIPALLSVGLKDTVCLPETIFAVYNRIPGPKTIRVYPFTGHAVVPGHNRLMLQFVREHFGLG